MRAARLTRRGDDASHQGGAAPAAQRLRVRRRRLVRRRGPGPSAFRGISRRSSGRCTRTRGTSALVESNPFSNLRLPALEKTEEIHSPSLAEYRRLLDACTVLGGHGGEFRAMIQFAAWTGIRAGELHAVQWDDIDEDYLWVRRSRKTDGSIGRPKNGRERKIVLLPPARVLDDVPRRADPFIFHTAQGEPLQKGNHHYGWRAVRAGSGIRADREANGLPDIRWHDLRHFCATQLLELGLDHFAVSVQLGHEDGGALVMSRYGHPSKDAARRRLLAAFQLETIETGREAGSG